MLAINKSAERTSPAELTAVKIITSRLGYLPLVLHSIGSYACNIASSYQTFLRHYADFDRNLLFQSGEAEPSSYQASVSATWTMTLSQIDQKAKTLMESVVLFEPDNIPLALFESCSVNDK